MSRQIFVFFFFFFLSFFLSLFHFLILVIFFLETQNNLPLNVVEHPGAVVNCVTHQLQIKLFILMVLFLVMKCDK